MTKIINFLKALPGIIGGLLLAGFVLMIIGAIAYDWHAAMTKRYWVYFGDKTLYTDEVKIDEDNNCITFVDEYGRDVIQCGAFRVKDTESN